MKKRLVVEEESSNAEVKQVQEALASMEGNILVSPCYIESHILKVLNAMGFENSSNLFTHEGVRPRPKRSRGPQTVNKPHNAITVSKYNQHLVKLVDIQLIIHPGTSLWIEVADVKSDQVGAGALTFLKDIISAIETKDLSVAFVLSDDMKPSRDGFTFAFPPGNYIKHGFASVIEDDPHNVLRDATVNEVLGVYGKVVGVEYKNKLQKEIHSQDSSDLNLNFMDFLNKTITELKALKNQQSEDPYKQ